MTDQAQPEKSEEESRQQKLNRVLRELPTGLRLVDLDGKERHVPESCKGGFGTWHPIKTECIGCNLYHPCFCKSTGTEAQIVEITKAKARRKKNPMSTSTTDNPTVDQRLNPFRRNSYDYTGRVLFLELVKRGVDKAGDPEMDTLANNLELQRKNDKSGYWHHHMHKYCAQNYSADRVPRNFELFYGLVTFSGSYKTNDKVFTIDLAAAKKIIDDITAEVEAAQASEPQQEQAQAAS